MQVTHIFQNEMFKGYLARAQPGKPWRHFTLDDAFKRMDMELVRRVEAEQGLSKLKYYFGHVHKASFCGDQCADLLEFLLEHREDLCDGPFMVTPVWQEGHFRTLEVLWKYRYLWPEGHCNLRTEVCRLMRKSGDERYARFYFEGFPHMWREVLEFCQSIDFAQSLLQRARCYDPPEYAMTMYEAGTMIYFNAIRNNNLKLMRFISGYDQYGLDGLLTDPRKASFWLVDELLSQPLTPLRKEVLIEAMKFYQDEKVACAYAFYMLDDLDLIKQPFEVIQRVEFMIRPQESLDEGEIIRLTPDDFLDLLISHGATAHVPEYRLREMVNHHLTPAKREALREPRFPLSQVREHLRSLLE